jgi:hypothetical protein
MAYLLTTIGFPSRGSGQYTCIKYKRNNYMNEEKQYTKQYKNTEHTK